MRHPLTAIGCALLLVGCTVGDVSEPAPTQPPPAPTSTTTVEVTTTMPAPSSTTEPAGVALAVTSGAFAHEAPIPALYTCDGEDLSPPLDIEGIPEDAVSLAIVMDDPDAPGGTWDHWVVYDIDITDSIPQGVSGLGTDGFNSWQRAGYGGPCPPSGIHRYFTTIYALDTRLGLAPGATSDELRAAMDGHILATGELMGTYGR